VGPVKLDARLTLFVTLVATSMVCLVVGNLIGGKLTSFELFGREWVTSAGNLAFPITFVLTDILNEFYGKTVVRRVTLISFAMGGLMILVIAAADALPWYPTATRSDWGAMNPEAFERVFTQATRIKLASMAAFLIGTLIDISIFFMLKRMTGDRALWLRATGSTVVSQLIDTVVVTALAFYEHLTFEQYVTAVTSGYVIKLCIAIAITPLLYALHALLENTFKIHPAPPAA